MNDIYSAFDTVPMAGGEKRRGQLSMPGKHLVRLDNIRESKESIYGFHFDYTVIEGPSGEGAEGTYSKFPFTPPKPSRDGKTIPQKTKTERDIADIKKCVAALFGINPKNIQEVVAKVNNEVLRRVVGTKESPSTLAGRLFVVHTVPSNGTNPTYVKSVEPHLVDGNVVDAEGFTKSEPANTNAGAAQDQRWIRQEMEAKEVPPPPPAPVTPTVIPGDNLARAEAAGFRVHPKNAEFYFRGQEVKSKADLIKGDF